MQGGEEKRRRERELDEAAARWKSCSEKGDMDAAQAQKDRIWLLVFELYDQDTPPGRSRSAGDQEEYKAREWDPNVIVDTLCEVFDKFTPEKGAFSHYFSHLFKRRQIDAHRRAKRLAPFHVSLERPLSGEGTMCVGDSIPSETDLEQELLFGMDAAVCTLISAMLELPRRLHGRANNPVRHNYFRMFFAETVVNCVQNASALEPFRRREGKLFQAMKVEFLDFFMAELCRGVDEIADSPLKPYGELVEGRGPEETKLPLPGDVYISYLGRREGVRVGPSAVSQQRTAYFQTIKGWLS